MLKNKIVNLIGHKGFQRYAANASWLIAEKLLRMTVGLFVSIWVARYLGPEQFGLFSYAQSFTFLFAAIATLGLDSIVIRELVKDDRRLNTLMGTAFFLKLGGAFLLLPFLYIAVGFTNNNDPTNHLIFIIASSTIFQSFNVIDFYCQSKVLSKYVAWSNGFLLFVSSGLKVFFILNEAPLVCFAYVILFDSVVLSLGLIYFYVRRMHLSITHWHFDYYVALELLKDSWPLILSSIVVSIYMKIDQVMIKEMMSAEAVGQYAAAVRLSEVWYFIPMTIAGSLFPAIVNAKNISNEFYTLRLQRLYTLMVWLGIAIALPVTFLSQWIITLLYGEVYQQASQVLMVHIWAGVFVFLGTAGAYFTIEKLTKIFFYKSLVGALANVLLNFWLIKYGLIYVALATLLSQLLSSFLLDFVFNKTRGQFYLKSYAFLVRW
ncbi:flippase [Marinomonas rhizomae]|uniref:flippase n=1 Tax=Marinomonas rhizomae TaxID=491948 RepID=UPI0021074382|nr:flippase [Marinomonas rhizomae]UTW00180.1 flippase [Marinomonas rhizomae]